MTTIRLREIDPNSLPTKLVAYSRYRRSPLRSKLLLVAIAALVLLAVITIIVSQEPGPIDPDNPPPATEPLSP